MTFGQTLKQVLAISGLRASYLANDLGYDDSYISRWLSGQKLPSLKYNDDLFAKISSIVIKNCTEESRQALVSEMMPQLRDSASAKIVESELSRLLSNAFYASGSSLSSGKFMSRTENCNANISVLPAKTVYQIFYDAMEYVSRTGSAPFINVIVNSPLHFHANEEFSIITNVPTDSGIKPLCMHQTVNLKDFKENVDLYCARICQFFGGAPRAYYHLYQTDDRPSTDDLFIVMEGGFLYFFLKNPYGGQAYSLISYDKDLVFEYFTSTEANLNLRPRLTSYFDYAWLLERKLVYRLLMGGKLSLLLKSMYPLFMTSEMFSELCSSFTAKEMEPQMLVSHYEKLWQAPKRAIIFKSALVNYICDGKIELFGQIVHLDDQIRKAHLQYLLSLLRNSEENSIAILNDDNPLLSYNECGISLFLSDGIAFAENLDADPEHRFIRLRSMEIIEYFFSFFDHLQSLDEKYILLGDEALDFIERGLEMI